MNFLSIKGERVIEVIKRSLPSTVQNQIRPLWRKGRSLQLRLRMQNGQRIAPTFMIIGVMKGGTTSLFQYLLMHPQIMAPFTKEIHYFDFNWTRPERWYTAHFPKTDQATAGEISGEASPGYLLSPDAAERVARQYPDIKLIVILRNPVYRAISHYFHERKLGWENRPMEEAILAPESFTYPELNDELALKWYTAYMNNSLSGPESKKNLVLQYPLNHAYIRFGMYADHLEPWFAHFKQNQFLIISSEQLYQEPKTVLGACEDFLGIDKTGIENFAVFNQGKHKEKVPDHLIEKLTGIYTEPNVRLKAMTGKDFGW